MWWFIIDETFSLSIYLDDDHPSGWWCWNFFIHLIIDNNNVSSSWKTRKRDKNNGSFILLSLFLSHIFPLILSLSCYYSGTWFSSGWNAIKRGNIFMEKIAQFHGIKVIIHSVNRWEKNFSSLFFAALHLRVESVI